MKSLEVERTLKILGEDLKAARRRRMLSLDDMSARIGISKPTLVRMEKGDPKVSMETYAMALMVYGKIGKLTTLFDEDRLASRYLEEMTIPKKIHSASKKLQKSKSSE